VRAGEQLGRALLGDGLQDAVIVVDGAVQLRRLPLGALVQDRGQGQVLLRARHGKVGAGQARDAVGQGADRGVLPPGELLQVREAAEHDAGQGRMPRRYRLDGRLQQVHRQVGVRHRCCGGVRGEHQGAQVVGRDRWRGVTAAERELHEVDQRAEALGHGLQVRPQPRHVQATGVDDETVVALDGAVPGERRERAVEVPGQAELESPQRGWPFPRQVAAQQALGDVGGGTGRQQQVPERQLESADRQRQVGESRGLGRFSHGPVLLRCRVRRRA
jgi:hypothetical protein